MIVRLDGDLQNDPADIALLLGTEPAVSHAERISRVRDTRNVAIAAARGR